jgi:membrane protein insertase Oxa1/YidC/SpoIIIJ
MLLKNSVRTSKRTPHFTITKINWLTLFKEIIAVYTENNTKPVNTNCSVTIVKSSRAYNWLWPLKGDQNRLITDKILERVLSVDAMSKTYKNTILSAVYMFVNLRLLPNRKNAVSRCWRQSDEQNIWTYERGGINGNNYIVRSFIIYSFSK